MTTKIPHKTSPLKQESRSNYALDQNGSSSDPPSGGAGGRSRYDQYSRSHPEPHHRQQHRSADLMDQDRPPPSSDYPPRSRTDMDSEYRSNVGDSHDRQPSARDYHQPESGERTHQSQYRRYSDADRGKCTSKRLKMSNPYIYLSC